MFSGSKKPYSAVTVQVERLTSEQYEEDDVSGIIDLVEVIRIQASGPTEAARAIRKKLKYGDTHRQLRALVILDGLIQNAGSRFQRTFADEPLLERLRQLPRDEVVESQVRQKCKVFFMQWANGYKNTPGLERIASLYKELPKSQKPNVARAKVLRDTEPLEADDSAPQVQSPPTSLLASRSRAVSSTSRPGVTPTPSRPVTLTPTSSSFSMKLSKHKKSSSKSFNLAKEKDNMTNCIARASIASTNLINGLQLINREKERVSEHPEVRNRFETCKSLRKQILGYIQQVESDDWIGSLVNANDELVKALTAYEIMDRSIEDDSDSDAIDDEGAAIESGHKRNVSGSAAHQLAGLSIDSPPARPPRAPPGPVAMPPPPSFSKTPVDDDEDDITGGDDDEDNPFGDSNAVATPRQERLGMTWKEV